MLKIKTTLGDFITNAVERKNQTINMWIGMCDRAEERNVELINENLELQQSCDSMKQTNEQNVEYIETIKRAFIEMCKEYLEDGGSYQFAYSMLRDTFDKDGFKLYFTAKELTGVNLYTEFYAEDCMGYFENLDGFGLLLWLERAKFGVNKYEISGSYELWSSGTIDRTTEQYRSFTDDLYRITVSKILEVAKATLQAA